MTVSRFMYRFFTLSKEDRRLVLQAGLLVGCVRLGLWVVSLRRVQGMVSRIVELQESRPGREHLAIDKMSWAVASASRYVPKATCLTQALALKILLARHGFPSQLCIGVANNGQGMLEGHAWLESQGRIVIGGQAVERYTRFAAFEG